MHSNYGPYYPVLPDLSKFVFAKLTNLISTREIFFGILLIQTIFGLLLHFSDRFSTRRNSHREIFSKSHWIKLKIRLYLPFFDGFGTKRTPVPISMSLLFGPNFLLFVQFVNPRPDWKNNSNQTYSWPRDWRPSSSWGPNPSDLQNHIVLRGLGRLLIGLLIYWETLIPRTAIHWENYISISFKIEWDMIMATVFLSILNWTEFHLIQNGPIQSERKLKYSCLSVVFSSLCPRF